MEYVASATRPAREKLWLVVLCLASLAAAWFLPVASASVVEAAANEAAANESGGRPPRRSANRELRTTVVDFAGRSRDVALSLFDTVAATVANVAADFDTARVAGLQSIARSHEGAHSFRDVPVGNKTLVAFDEELGWVRCENIGVGHSMDVARMSLVFPETRQRCRITNDTDARVEFLPVYGGLWPDLCWSALGAGQQTQLLPRHPDGMPDALLVRDPASAVPRILDVGDGAVSLASAEELAPSAVLERLGPDLPFSAFSIVCAREAAMMAYPLASRHVGVEVSTHQPFALVHVEADGAAQLRVTDGFGALRLSGARDGRYVLFGRGLYGYSRRFVGFLDGVRKASVDVSLRSLDHLHIPTEDYGVATSPHALVGFVQAEGREPVEGVSIVLVSLAGDTTRHRRATTDERGFYSIEGLSPYGRYELHAFRRREGPAYREVRRLDSVRRHMQRVDLELPDRELTVRPPSAARWFLRFHDGDGKQALSLSIEGEAMTAFDLPVGAYTVEARSTEEVSTCECTVNSSGVDWSEWVTTPL